MTEPFIPSGEEFDEDRIPTRRPSSARVQVIPDAVERAATEVHEFSISVSPEVDRRRRRRR